MAERVAYPTWVPSYHPTDTEKNLDVLAAMVEVLLPDYPVITDDLPEDVAVTEGESQEFAVVVADPERGTLTYQWQLDPDGKGFQDIVSATSATLTVASWSEPDEGTYRCKVINTYNNTTATIYSVACVATTDAEEE